jgi:hypothetical protein
VPDEQGAENVARQLDKLAEAGAGAAALLVRAQLADKTGNSRRATALIDEAITRLPADAPPLTRLRFVSALATIRSSADKLDDAVRFGHEALKLADARGDARRQAEVRNDPAYSYSRPASRMRAPEPRSDGYYCATATR